jgi:hypothetical protein
MSGAVDEGRRFRVSGSGLRVIIDS